MKENNPKKENKMDEKEVKKEKEQIFSSFNITKKAANIKLKIDRDTKLIKKKNKILNTVEYGNDVNFRNYMLYLDNMRKKEEEEYLEYLRQKNKKNPLLSKLDINKKISFSDFCDKYNFNKFMIDYFDYYEIQKINKKQTAELIRRIKQTMKKKSRIYEEKNLNMILTESSKINNRNKFKQIEESFSNFKRRISLLNMKEYQKKIEKRLSALEHNKNKNKIYIDGVDFNLIKSFSPEFEENAKKYQDLLLINEIKKDKNNFYKNMNKHSNNKKNSNNKYISDEFTIAHSLDTKNQKKLKRLKLLIKKKLDKERPKTTKTLSNNDFQYLNYIPDSSRYKHINYHKNLIFNNEYNTNNTEETKNKYNNIKAIKTESDIYQAKDLMMESTNVINNLNKIKSVLKQDKKYTSKTITRANTAFKKNNRTKADQKFMGNLMKDKKKNINKIKEMKDKMKNNEKLNVFNEFKDMTKKIEKNKIELTDVFTKTLNSLCKEEKKFNKQYNFFLKNNYKLKLEGIEEDNIENKKAKENIQNYSHSYEKLKMKILKRYRDINNIIKTSKQKSKF